MKINKEIKIDLDKLIRDADRFSCRAFRIFDEDGYDKEIEYFLKIADPRIKAFINFLEENEIDVDLNCSIYQFIEWYLQNTEKKEVRKIIAKMILKFYDDPYDQDLEENN